MTAESSAANRALAQLVERQMRNWELSRAQTDRSRSTGGPESFHHICLSHAPGLSTDALAERLGDRLGWPVFSRDILREMADNDNYRERIYQFMEGRDLSWIEQMAMGMAPEEPDAGDYFDRLVKTVLAIARRGYAVFVGHDADLILPRDRGLRACLVASEEYRAKQRAQSDGIALHTARKQIHKLDEAHTDYLRRHFGRDRCGVERHDLTLNVETLSEDALLDIIIRAANARHPAPDRAPA